MQKKKKKNKRWPQRIQIPVKALLLGVKLKLLDVGGLVRTGNKQTKKKKKRTRKKK